MKCRRSAAVRDCLEPDGRGESEPRGEARVRGRNEVSAACGKLASRGPEASGLPPADELNRPVSRREAGGSTQCPGRPERARAGRAKHPAERLRRASQTRLPLRGGAAGRPHVRRPRRRGRADVAFLFEENPLKEKGSAAKRTSGARQSGWRTKENLACCGIGLASSRREGRDAADRRTGASAEPSAPPPERKRLREGVASRKKSWAPAAVGPPASGPRVTPKTPARRPASAGTHPLRGVRKCPAARPRKRVAPSGGDPSPPPQFAAGSAALPRRGGCGRALRQQPGIIVDGRKSQIGN